MDDFIRDIDSYGYNVTYLSPLALLITLAMCVLIFRARKGSAAIPIFIVASYITNIQRIVIAGLDFDMLRIVDMFSDVIRVRSGIRTMYAYRRGSQGVAVPPQLP